VAETGTPSEEAPGDTADRALRETAAVVPPAWDPAAEAEVVEAEVVVAVGGVGKRLGSRKKVRRKSKEYT
jgi:hypothetical protein